MTISSIVKKIIKAVMPYGLVTYVQNSNDRKLIKEVHCDSKKIFKEYYIPKYGITDTYKKKIKNKKIIYIADDKYYRGGLADRFRGMTTLYKISKMLNVDYKINMTSPVNLTHFLVPNIYNWVTQNDEIIYDVKYSAICRWKASLFSEHQVLENVKLLLKKWKQLHISTNVPPPDYEYGELFNELFKPADELGKNIEYHLSEIGCDFISVTFRFQKLLGDFIEQRRHPILPDTERIKLIDRCVEHLMQIYKENNYQKILVTSDSITFLDKVREFDFVYVIPGKIAHIAYERGLEKEIYMKSFLDYFLLTYSKLVYQVVDGQMYNSGFPYRATLHNYQSNYPYKLKIYRD